jgi:isoquinoline 1-oxidoreductase subunit alpha
LQIRWKFTGSITIRSSARNRQPQRAAACACHLSGAQHFISNSEGFSMTQKLTVNNQTYEVDVPPDMPLLWVIRDTIGLTGTKFGCGIAACGACTVHIDGVAVRSCTLPIGNVNGKVTTIEGLSAKGDHPVQKAWLKNMVPQCGYCQSGQMMQAASLLKMNPKPSDEDIDAAMAGNICRCGTYTRIRAAIKEAAGVKS